MCVTQHKSFMNTYCALNASGMVNAASSGLFKGVLKLWHLKWQEHGRQSLQTKTRILCLT